jgi:hypothetical protein
MSADLSLVLAILLFVIAAALAAYGIWKLDARLLAGGGLAAGGVWLLAGWLNESESMRYELVSLKFVPVDAVNGAAVGGVAVESSDPSDAVPPDVCRLPSAAQRAGNKSTEETIVVSIVVELHRHGSLIEQLWRPDKHTTVIDQPLKFTAPGYQAWQTNLLELLPAGWPATLLDRRPISIEMVPHRKNTREQASS